MFPHHRFSVFQYIFFLLEISNVLKITTHAESGSDGTHTDAHAADGMFINWSEQWLEDIDTNQKNYGMAVSDVDHDGKFDIIVAGFMGPNLVLKYNKHTDSFVNIALVGSPYEALRDPKGQAIGVGACDIDGDGLEEIYFLNTNDAYAGISTYSDKLFKWRGGQYVDLYSDPVNTNISVKSYAGRSVACLDRYGTGKYGFVIATYARAGAGQFSLVEMDDFHQGTSLDSGIIVLTDVASEAGLKKSTGGRGVVVGPLLNSEGKSDIFFANEGNTFLENRGDNFLFKNMGNGTFINIAKQLGVSDETQAGRGVSIIDFNGDGLLDIICGNYDGPSRLYIQNMDSEGKRTFSNKATPDLEEKRLVRTALVADFDNDGHPEIFFNNIYEHPNLQPNALFTVTSYGPDRDPGISKVEIGDAREEAGYGTGAVYLDVDDDGLLDLVVSHGEGLPQPIEVYRTFKGKTNQYLRVYVFTKYGAPARGAVVQVVTNRGKKMSQVIDGGSGYLCQMEPIAHFGLANDKVTKITINWPCGKSFVWIPKDSDVNTTLLFYHPDYFTFQAALKASNMTTTTVANVTTAHTHSEL